MKKAFCISVLLTFLFCSSFAQCYPDRHTTSTNTQWISCSASSNPNGSRGNSHWIMYTLPQVEGIGSMEVWNYNHPDNLDYGVSSVVVDISNDGTNWKEVQQLNVPISEGSAIYEGTEVGDILGQSARYILVTLLDNHGGSCYGLGEVRITTHDFSACQTQHILPGAITAQAYHASQDILSTGTSQMGDDVYFNAGQEIQMDAGFEVELGSKFVASILDCN